MANTTDNQTSNKIKWAYTTLAVIITWFALVLQFSISIPAYLDKGCSLRSALIQLFSFYTILSNLLMVAGLTTILIAAKSAWGRFFLRNTVLTSIALYMTIVGLTYNILLRNVWHPEHLFKLADELLHVVNPILFLIYWLAFVPKDDLKYRNVWPWLCFPFLYFVYVLIRGAISGNYPYPFLDVAKSGYPQVLLNAVILLPIFWGLGALFVFIARQMKKPVL
ncbi:MAG: Pr6Pr family membrane protein [Mucilaginibacter sp.]